jgi:hypothetical protein
MSNWPPISFANELNTQGEVSLQRNRGIPYIPHVKGFRGHSSLESTYKKDSLGDRCNLNDSSGSNLKSKGPDSNYRLFRLNWPNFEEKNQELSLGILQSAVGDGSCLYNSIAKNSGKLSRYNDDPKNVSPIYRDIDYLNSDTGTNHLSVSDFFEIDFNNSTSLMSLGSKTVKKNRFLYITTFKSILKKFLTRPYFVSSETPLSINVLDTDGFVDNKLPTQNDDHSDTGEVSYEPISEEESKIRLFRNYEFFRRVFMSKLRDSRSFVYTNEKQEDLDPFCSAISSMIPDRDTKSLLVLLEDHALKRDILLGTKDVELRIVKGKVLSTSKVANNGRSEMSFDKDGISLLKSWGKKDIQWFYRCYDNIHRICEESKDIYIVSAIREIITSEEGVYQEYVKDFQKKHFIGDKDLYSYVMGIMDQHNKRMEVDSEYSDYIQTPEMLEIYHGIYDDLNAGGEMLDEYNDMSPCFTCDTDETKEILIKVIYFNLMERMEIQLPISEEVASKITPYMDIMKTEEEYIDGLLKFLESKSDNLLLITYFVKEGLSEEGKYYSGETMRLLRSKTKSCTCTYTYTYTYKILTRVFKELAKLQEEVRKNIYISDSHSFTGWEYDRISVKEFDELSREQEGDKLGERIYKNGYIDVDTNLPVTREDIYQIFNADYRDKKDLDTTLFSPITDFSDGEYLNTDLAHKPNIGLDRVYYQIGNCYMFINGVSALSLYALEETFKVRSRYGGHAECIFISNMFNLSIYLCEVHDNFLHVIGSGSSDYQDDYKGTKKRIFIDRIGGHFQSIGICNTDERGVHYAECVFSEEHPLFIESSDHKTKYTAVEAFDYYSSKVEYDLLEFPKDEDSVYINTKVNEGSVFVPYSPPDSPKHKKIISPFVPAFRRYNPINGRSFDPPAFSHRRYNPTDGRSSKDSGSIISLLEIASSLGLPTESKVVKDYYKNIYGTSPPSL